MHSEPLNEKQKKENIQIVILNTENSNTDSIDKVLEELFTLEEKGIYIRDIAEAPEGHPFVLKNILSYISKSTNQEIMTGINSPMLYVDLQGSHTALHIEDQNLCSLNYHVEGSPKIWCIVDKSMGAELTKRFAVYLKEKQGDACPQALEHKIYTITPKLLKEWGIPYKILEQRPGDLFFIRSGTYHTVVNMGRNTAEAVNVGSDLWNANYDAPVCSCSDIKRKYVPKNRAIVYTVKKTCVLHICSYERCNKSFKTMKLLKTHEKIVHHHDESNTTFTCAECSKQFKKKYNLICHLRTHEDKNADECTICKKKFVNLKKYEQDVHSRKNLTCERCGKKVRKINYNKHVANCKISCTICNKIFTSPRYLKQHANSKHPSSK